MPGVFPAAPKPAVAAGQRPTAAAPKDRHEQIQQHLQTAKDSLKAAAARFVSGPPPTATLALAAGAPSASCCC